MTSSSAFLPGPCARRGLRPFVAAVLLACGLLMAAVALPTPAHAEAFELPRVNIQAQVERDGSLLVTEGRTFAFEDDVNGVFWNIPFATNEQGIPSSVTVLGVSAHDGELGNEAVDRRGARPLSEVASASNGDADVYTVEDSGGALNLRVYVPREDGDETTIWVSYRIEGAVMAWADTAELYWQFIGSEWEQDAADVALSVTFLGAEQGAPAKAGTSDANLRAWGHGPLDGEVALDAERPRNPVVTLMAPRVHAGQFAEVRCVFPADWVPGLEAAGGARLDDVMAEEAAWAEEANAQRERARVIAWVGTAVLVVTPAVLLASALWLRKTKFASPRPVFDETYFRDLPSSDHPAVLSALMHDGAVQDCAFIATLMKLTDDRVIKVSHRARTEDRLLGLGKKTVEEYSIQLVARELASDPIDLAALDLYFGPDAKNGRAQHFSSFQYREDTGERLQAFKDRVMGTLEYRNLGNLAPVGCKVAMVFLAVVVALAGLLFMVMTDGVSLPFVMAGIAMAVAAAVVAGTTKQHSPEAVELLCRCRALERWLVDFTNLDEAVPSDLILWNKMLVLAVAFGVSDEVLRRLADAVPVDLREDENGTYYYPSYWWYYSRGGMGSPMSEMHDVYRATVAELASSADSSASGGGGGFSGGGGGGVGGGGGGSF